MNLLISLENFKIWTILLKCDNITDYKFLYLIFASSSNNNHFLIISPFSIKIISLHAPIMSKK